MTDNFAVGTSSSRTLFIERREYSERESRCRATYRSSKGTVVVCHRVRRCTCSVFEYVQLTEVVLTYLSKEDWGAKKKRHVSAHPGHLRSRHDPSSYSKYDYSQSSVNPWQAYNLLSSSRRLAHLGNESEAPYTMAHFAILLQDRNTKHPVHQFTGLSDNPRQGDLDVKDIASWHKQYPELNFHQTEEWRDRSIVVCDASIKVMADRQLASEKQPPCNLAIEYYINSQRDFSEMEPMQSRTRFYDEGELVDQYDENEQGNDNGREEPKKETWADCQYANSHSRMLRFASNFWARRMAGLRTKLQTAQAQDEESSKVKIENGVRRQLQYMTAVQDIFGTSKETGEQHCFLTILWRFRQTRTPSEAGKMTWRVVNFESPAQQQQCQPWIKDEQTDNAHDLRMILNSTTADPSPPIYPSLPLDLAHQTFAHRPPPLDLDSLSNIPMDSLHDFSAPSMSADYSQTQSLSSLTHSYDLGAARSQDFHDPNDIDFQGGHIHMNILEPAINFGAYEDYTTHAPSLHHINSLVSGLEPAQTDSPFGDLDFGAVTMASGCYPSKPWNYNGLITHLEGVAEQTQLLDQTSHAHAQDGIAGHGVLHDGQLGSSLWKLQAPFGEDATMGAAEGRREGQGSVSGGGLLELIERDQRRGKEFKGF
jgi:transcriptional enhancer factor